MNDGESEGGSIEGGEGLKRGLEDEERKKR